MGNTEHEGETFIMNRYSYLTSPEYSATLTAFYRTSVGSVLYWYPPSVFGDNRRLFSQLISDYLFVAPSRYTFMQMRKFHPRQRLWYYHWNRHTVKDMWGPGWEFCMPYACHSVNIPYVFQTFENFTREEIDLSDKVIEYYKNFMYTGNPNGKDLVGWPEFDGEEFMHLDFDVPLSSGPDLRREYTDFWSKFGFHHGIGPVNDIDIEEWQKKLGLKPGEAQITEKNWEGP